MDRRRTISVLLAMAVVAACTGPAATSTPTAALTVGPTPTPAATVSPTEGPTEAPTEAPTEVPTEAPTEVPTLAPSPTAAAVSCEGETLSFMLSFFPNVQHIGFLLADARGYYEDEGVTVDIQAGGPNVNTLSAIADGTVESGQPDFGEVARAVAAGAPVKAVAQIYQRSFLFHFALKESGIDTVADWAGMRVGQIQAGLAPERDTMLAQAGLSTADVELVQQDFGVTDFLAGNVDIGSGVVFFHPAALVLDGTYAWPDDFNVFVPDDFGAPIASQTVAANQETIDNKPEALACFLRASIRGWQDAIADPEAALADTSEMIDPEGFPPEHQELAFNDIVAIVQPEGTGEEVLLRPDAARYEESLQLLQDVGYLEDPVTVDQVFDPSIWDSLGRP